jgi:glycosyltransferase involved in cell wall biosynthesis
LTAVEAMACGVPVLASTGGLADEAAGDAVELFDTDAAPDASGGLVACLTRLLADDVRRAELIAAGRSHAAALSTDRLAGRMLALYAELAATHV